MNDDNLIPFNKRSEDEVRAMNKKGGINSGKARRAKADLRKAMQLALEQEWTDKKGNKRTGQEIAIAGLIANLTDPTSRNWNAAFEKMLLLTNQSMTKDQIAKIKADVALLKAKTNAIEQNGGSMADIEDLTPLADMLRGDEDGNTDINN